MITVLASATGAPGVTSTALGLALTWPRDILLADCDRDPSQAVLAGWLHGTAPGDRGLAGLARAHRSETNVAELLWENTLDLGGEPRGGEPVQRRFLPGFAYPGAADAFTPVWPDLLATFEHLRCGGIDVLIDAGRIGVELPRPIMAAADHVVVVARATLRSLAATRLQLVSLLDRAPAAGFHGRLEVLIIGPGRPYTVVEIQPQLPVPVLGTVTWSPREAAVLSEGEPPPRAFMATPLLRSLRALGSSLYQAQTESSRARPARRPTLQEATA